MRALVLLRWSPRGGNVGVRRLEVSEALAHLPLYSKDLGAFDLDRELSAPPAPDVERRDRAILDGVTVVEVTGAPDFPRLVALVADLLGR